MANSIILFKKYIDMLDEVYKLISLTAYMPTPTIVEAAQALYCGHRVEEIARLGCLCL